MFVALRLKKAREARGLTQVALAELAGLSKQSISYYERGEQCPRQEGLSALAQALKFPEAYFFKPLEPHENPVFFRKLAAVTATERRRAEARLDWIAELVDVLCEYLDLVPVKVPNYDLGCHAEKFGVEKAEDIAIQTRKDLGLGDGPIPNLTTLLENIGIIITKQQFEGEGMDAFSTWLRRGVPLIVANDCDSAVRHRFNLAHELGHLAMHRSMSQTKGNIKILDGQANRFASAFLLPEQGFTNSFSAPSLDAFKALKSIWLVAIQAQLRRSFDLGIIDSNSYRNANIVISRRGWRRKEPLDDTIVCEEPRFLRRCLELLADSKITTASELAQTLALDIRDFAELANIPIDAIGTKPMAPAVPHLRIVR